MIKIVDSINSWAQAIIIAVVIGTIIEMVVPEGKNKKYIKTVIGMYLLFVIIYPIITKVTNKTINFKNLDISNYSSSKTHETSINTDKYIESTYENNLKQEISLLLKEKGYIARNIFFKTSSDYKQIVEISLDIQKEEISNQNINMVKEVEIDTTIDSESKKEEDISIEEINEIKSFLSEELNLDKDKIQVN